MRRPRSIVIGGGHNGLVAAFLLARAGHAVTLLERAPVIGGCAVTEEFHPGFRNSVAAYTVSLLQPAVIRAMDLPGHGLRIVRRPMANWLPTEDGRALAVGPADADTRRSVHAFHAADAARLADYQSMIGRAADILRGLALKPPPRGVADWPAWLGEVAAVARLPLAERRDLVALFTRSAGDLLDGWFAAEPVKALFGFDSVVGALQSPRTPGSAYVLLHHCFGEVDGVRGAWGHAIGGMGAITQAMASACRAAGVDIRTDAGVRSVDVVGDRIVGVTLEDGRSLEAQAIVSTVDPGRLFTRLLAAAPVDSDTAARMRRYRLGSGSFRMNLALSALPRFTAAPEPGPHLGAGIILAPSLDWMHRAFVDSEALGWSRAPVIEMLIPSTIDSSLAPAGCHVASLFCQHFAPLLPDGRSWDLAEAEAVETILATVERFAPGLRSLICGMQVLSPLGLERRFGLTRGDIFHGQMGLDQLWVNRPLAGLGSHRGPFAGLYLGGSGSHPGGGVTGAPGWLAARAVIADQRAARWLSWRHPARRPGSRA